MRPEAMRLCHLWVQRQTLSKNREYQKDQVQWLVLDDTPEGGQTHDPFMGMSHVIKPEPSWEPGQNTQGRNLLAGLEKCKGEFIAIIEDDDWYAPDYLEKMLEIMESYKALVIGEAGAIFYNVRERSYQRYRNQSHAGLCQTIFRRSLIPLLVQAIHTAATLPKTAHVSNWWLDVGFWNLIHKDVGKQHVFLFPEAMWCVGIKGMPGREGIGTGHSIEKEKGWVSDPQSVKLQQLIGADSRHYEKFYKELSNA